jgi:hypothetical protein
MAQPTVPDISVNSTKQESGVPSVRESDLKGSAYRLNLVLNQLHGLATQKITVPTIVPLTFVADGIQVTFPLPDTPTDGTLLVFRNGILQREGQGFSYVFAQNKVTFTAGLLLAGDWVFIQYQKS